MRNLRFVLLFCISALFLAGCDGLPPGLLLGEAIRGTGETEVREFDFAGFDRVEAGHTFDVVVRQGDTYRVTVEADVALLPHLDVTASGDTLWLRLEQGVRTRGPITLRAEVTLPTLTSAHVSGAGEMDVAGFGPADTVEFQVSGASELRAEMDASTLRLTASGASHARVVGNSSEVQLEVSGSSEVTLQGSGERVTANVSGASQLDLEAFPVATANFNASGASSISAHVTQQLDAQASGASSIRYAGQPAMRNQSASGASTIGPR